ncbi:two-component system sensor kinase [Microbacterium esteraromaticum]|uniref:histidine kinase n=1 Tax=Microbacterium esteraromaticum TaxID=57043 RepID=A0A1R4KD89_9MICO|nr:two-component system sensor kinase [Microbacterium esteraromaticum]
MLDIVGAVLGLVITVPLTLVVASNTVSGWLVDSRVAIGLYIVVGVILWAAAAITRLSPPLALGLAWVGALLQMAGGLWPGLIDVAIFGVLFGASAWGSRRIMWMGGASVLIAGGVAGLYVPIVTGVAPSSDPAAQWQNIAIGILIAVTVFFALALSWGAGLLWRSVRRGRTTREAQLRAEAVAAEEQERVRIARDMHDVVAHSLAVVVAQADGARYAASAHPELAQEALGTIAQTARSALSDVRMLLTQLRHRQGDGPQPTLADLETLFAQVRHAGIEPRVTVDPMPPGEPPAAIQLAVYRILQEALTNALRHGEGGVDVRLSWWSDRVEIEVRNAAGEAAVGTGPGYGLVGMRERAQLTGGTLVAERDAGCFVVTATLPIGASPPAAAG